MSVIRIGFTGPRGGMTQPQIRMVHDYMASVALVSDNDDTVEGFEGHHGDCLGSDAAFHVIATALRWHTVIHPPSNLAWRAYCKGGEIRPAADYLARDWDIARETGELLATPDCPPKRGSGTWVTISYAVYLGHPVRLFWPDGSTGSGSEFRDAMARVGLLP